MTIASRTPEGTPSECPLCGATTNIEFSPTTRDAPCPNCGCLLWASSRLLQSIAERYSANLGIMPAQLNAGTSFSILGADSLDTMEAVMNLQDDYGIAIPEEVVERLITVGDLVRYIEEQQRRSD